MTVFVFLFVVTLRHWSSCEEKTTFKKEFCIYGVASTINHHFTTCQSNKLSFLQQKKVFGILQYNITVISQYYFMCSTDQMLVEFVLSCYNLVEWFLIDALIQNNSIFRSSRINNPKQQTEYSSLCGPMFTQVYLEFSKEMFSR